MSEDIQAEYTRSLPVAIEWSGAQTAPRIAEEVRLKSYITGSGPGTVLGYELVSYAEKGKPSDRVALCVLLERNGEPMRVFGCDIQFRD